MEGLNKDLGTTTLVTEETLAAVGDRVRVRDCGPQAVKGRVEKVRVFEVLVDGRTQTHEGSAWWIHRRAAGARRRRRGPRSPLAVLTEIQVKRGKVEVKPTGQPDWQPPKPLLSLRAATRCG